MRIVLPLCSSGGFAATSSTFFAPPPNSDHPPGETFPCTCTLPSALQRVGKCGDPWKRGRQRACAWKGFAGRMVAVWRRREECRRGGSESSAGTERKYDSHRKEYLVAEKCFD